MKTYWYTLELNPIPWRVGPVGATRNASTGRMKGYVGPDQELKTYQEAVRAELLNQPHVKVNGNIEVKMWFWRTQTERTGTKRDGKGSRAAIADGTNMYKATEDACQKILFDNDRANIHGDWYIVEQGPDAPSRVIISVSELPDTYMEDALQLIPDEVYSKAFPSAAQQLELAMNAPNTSLPGGDWHTDEPEAF